MTMGSPKSTLIGVISIIRSRSSIVIMVAGLAFFLLVASLLSSYPFSSSIQGYLLEGALLESTAFVSSKGNHTKVVGSKQGTNVIEEATRSENERVLSFGSELSSDVEGEILKSIRGSDSSNGTKIVDVGKAVSSGFKNDSEKVGMTNDSFTKIISEVTEIDKEVPSGFKNDSQKVGLEVHNEEPTHPDVISLPSEVKRENGKDESRNCDLYHGKWIYDTTGPLYTNNSCPIITQMQNCQGNGRPDKDYENYRWKPDQCDIPRFNPRKFLELMRGKTLAFIGDSVARNHFESLLCILWQEEAPRNRGNRRMQRWYFKSTSTALVRIWSSWLVNESIESFQFAPKGITKLFLDIPDEKLMDLLPSFDVVVLSSGHWFAKPSVYVLNNTIVGGQLWWPKSAGKMKINNIEAFGISVETAMSAIANHPNFKGLAIVRSYSPDHYEGGAWNTGGSCTGKVRPLSRVVRNGFTDTMHAKQVTGFRKAVEKSGIGSSVLRMMDITEAFGYRSDGHPGPYRSPDPNKITVRGPNGNPPPQDCLHWCMPGPIDTWNEILLEVIRREFEGA